MTNYTNLPPGRSRAQAYSMFLKERINRIYNIRRSRISLRTLRLSPIIRTSSYPILPISPIIRTTSYPILSLSYENLSLLKDVKVGLISKNLIEKSNLKLLQQNEKNNFCIICQDNIKLNEIIRIINCSHLFHVNCIDNWFIENKKCPMCNFEI